MEIWAESEVKTMVLFFEVESKSIIVETTTIIAIPLERIYSITQEDSQIKVRYDDAAKIVDSEGRYTNRASELIVHCNNNEQARSLMNRYYLALHKNNNSFVFSAKTKNEEATTYAKE